MVFNLEMSLDNPFIGICTVPLCCPIGDLFNSVFTCIEQTVLLMTGSVHYWNEMDHSSSLILVKDELKILNIKSPLSSPPSCPKRGDRPSRNKGQLKMYPINGRDQMIISRRVVSVDLLNIFPNIQKNNNKIHNKLIKRFIRIIEIMNIDIPGTHFIFVSKNNPSISANMEKIHYKKTCQFVSILLHYIVHKLSLNVTGELYYLRYLSTKVITDYKKEKGCKFHPARSLDDFICLSIAQAKDGQVLSNDNMRDSQKVKKYWLNHSIDVDYQIDITQIDTDVISIDK